MYTNSHMSNDQVFFVGQKAFIEKDGAVLVLFDKLGIDFPGGKIQEHEMDLSESLKREVLEETNLQVEVGDPFFTWIYPFEDGHQYAGKKLFLVGYTCTLLSGEFKISNEHESYKWVTQENYTELDDGSDFYKALELYFAKKKD